MKEYLLEKRDDYRLANGGIAEKTLTSVANGANIKGLKREKSILGSTIGIEE